jgi:hypothetical protein
MVQHWVVWRVSQRETPSAPDFFLHGRERKLPLPSSRLHDESDCEGGEEEGAGGSFHSHHLPQRSTAPFWHERRDDGHSPFSAYRV